MLGSWRPPSPASLSSLFPTPARGCFLEFYTHAFSTGAFCYLEFYTHVPLAYLTRELHGRGGRRGRDGRRRSPRGRHGRDGRRTVGARSLLPHIVSAHFVRALHGRRTVVTVGSERAPHSQAGPNSSRIGHVLAQTYPETPWGPQDSVAARSAV